MFTDGSITNDERGCAIIIADSTNTPDTTLSFELPPSFSIFSCETFAILQALTVIEKFRITVVATLVKVSDWNSS